MPLTEPQIETLTNQYLREMARFEKAAAYVADRLRRELRAAALRTLISFRAKHPDEFRGKLLRNASKYSFDALSSDPGRVVTDLAGCRVLVYESADEERAAEVAKRVLSLASLSKAEEKHNKESGYRATHLLVFVPEESESLSFQGTTCEIQITSLSAHLFNELEHDIKYKDHGVVSSKEEKAILEELLYGTRLLDRIAARLVSARTQGLLRGTRVLSTPEELRQGLERELDRPMRGDFARLLQLLRGLVEPLTLASLMGLGEPAAIIERGRQLSHRMGFAPADDVVYFALGLLPQFKNEVSTLLKQWKGPNAPLKRLLQQTMEALTKEENHA